MKFKGTNDISITTASLIDPLHWGAIIARVKSLIRHGAIEDIGIPSLCGKYSKHALATIHAKYNRKAELNSLTKGIQNLKSVLLTYINRIVDQLENRRKEGQCQ